MVRWNLIFLLEKFGTPKADGIQITSSELVQRYRTFLKSSLQVSEQRTGYSVSFPCREAWFLTVTFRDTHITEAVVDSGIPRNGRLVA
jgi:hypothetical protein